ncbi:unnamed protein product [Brassica oleracea var. botrytis]
MRFRASSCPCFVILGRPRKIRSWIWFLRLDTEAHSICSNLGFAYCLVIIILW